MKTGSVEKISLTLVVSVKLIAAIAPALDGVSRGTETAASASGRTGLDFPTHQRNAHNMAAVGRLPVGDISAVLNVSVPTTVSPSMFDCVIESYSTSAFTASGLATMFGCKACTGLSRHTSAGKTEAAATSWR